MGARVVDGHHQVVEQSAHGVGEFLELLQDALGLAGDDASHGAVQGRPAGDLGGRRDAGETLHRQR